LAHAKGVGAVTAYDFAPRSTAEDNIFHEVMDMVPMGTGPQQVIDTFNLIVDTIPLPKSPEANVYVQAELVRIRESLLRIRERLLHALAGRELLRDIREIANDN
jgi:hypothetical protein